MRELIGFFGLSLFMFGGIAACIFGILHCINKWDNMSVEEQKKVARRTIFGCLIVGAILLWFGAH